MIAGFPEIFSLLSCFIASGFFSGAEAVLLTISVDRAKQLIEEGGRKGKALKFMSEHSSEMLTTILVGNNLVNIFAASMVTTIASRYFHDDAIAISVGITTIIILLFGEIFPKSFARAQAEKVVFPVIKILQFNYFLLYPVVKMIGYLILKVLGENAKLMGRLITKDDIEFMINRAEKEKTIDSKQIDLLNSILEFPTIKVKDIIIPRSDVKWIKKDATFNQIIKIVREDNHSRYPVCGEDLDHTLGFLHVKDLVFVRGHERANFETEKYLKPPFFVYEHMKIQAVFDHMNRKKVHLALVKDENGLVVGIITLEDIIEEIFGEINDEHDKSDDTPDLIAEEGGIAVEGKISLRNLYNDYDIKIPLNDNYSTLAGFILDMLGNNFPEEGQMIVWEGLSFELIKVVDHTILEVHIEDVDGEKHFYSKKEANEAFEEESGIDEDGIYD